MPAHRVLLPLILAAGLSVPACPQSLGTDLFVSHPNGELVRLTRAGARTKLGRFTSGLFNMLTVDTDNKTIVGLDASLATNGPQSVLRIDPVAQTIVATVMSGAPLIPFVNWIDVDQDGDYLVCHGSSSTRSDVVKVKRDGSGMTTVFAGGQGRLFNCFAEDRTTGDWILGSFTPKSIVHVDRNTGTVKRTVPLNTAETLQGMAQDPHGPAVYFNAGSGATLRRYDPTSGTVTTLATGLSSNSMTVDRSPDGTGALLYVGLTGGGIQKYDRAGTNLGLMGVSGNNAMGVAFDRSRNLGPELQNPPNDRIVRVSFPGDGGKPFIFALSLSGNTPGVPLPDGRVLPLNPDDLTVATSKFQLPPLLSGNLGVLSASGEATVRLDLNSLPLPGVRLWAAAITFDPKAPFGISQISGPLLFVL